VKALRSELLRRTADAAAHAPSALRDRLNIPDRGDVAIAPSEDQLRRWSVAVGLDYQAWCMHHGFVTLAEWWRQRDRAATGATNPLFISVLTPVHDTPVDFLREAVYSVMVQSNPYWELCIVDDASSAPDTLAELERLRGSDPRIRVERSDTNLGICDATNRALAIASAPYIAFLDHDDRLAPDALFHVAQAIAAEPGLDLVYSDRDLLDTDNYRTAPTFKPGWAPETLLGGNYMFHLMVYRRTLVERLGGYRPEFEGSQDLDLVLRTVETTPLVRHIPRVLYHWRQHEGSMALLPEQKPHIFAAGKAAVAAALERRGIEGRVEEIPDIWRGHYRIELPGCDGVAHRGTCRRSRRATATSWPQRWPTARPTTSSCSAPTSKRTIQTPSTSCARGWACPGWSPHVGG
jgi:O-antigen biosynthesis protein